MTRNNVVELFGLIKAIYQNQFDADDLAVDVWLKLLANLPSKDVFGALYEFANEGGNFPPNCPQLLKRAKSCNDLATSPTLMAATSWREILSNRGRTSDPTGAEALRLMGGWPKVGFMPEKQVEIWGWRKFVELYVDLAERERVLHLIDESDNSPQSGIIAFERG